MVHVQLSQERLDGQGGHFLTTWRRIVDDYQGQGGEEEAAVLLQQILSRDKTPQEHFSEMYKAIIKSSPARLGRFPHLREGLEDVGQHLQHRLPARFVLVVQL